MDAELILVQYLRESAILGQPIEQIAAEFTDLLAESDNVSRVRLLAYFVVLFGDAPTHQPYTPSLN